ncbi:MAG: hypothetical protein LBH72_06575, partial [Proteiniphilum sp.]|nr:hypothetical protein [Proteiniphilum sp.]
MFLKKSRSGENQLGERRSGKGREHPPRRAISLLSDFFVNCLHCDSSDLRDLHDLHNQCAKNNQLGER